MRHRHPLILVLACGLSGAAGAADSFYKPPVCADVLAWSEDGIWFVAQGGDTPNVNEHMLVPNQMFGLDLARCGGESLRSLHAGDGKRTGDYFSWGQPVLCPADGVVERVSAGAPDNAIGVQDELNPFGNYVQIRLAAGDRLVLAHLQKDSIAVRAGAAVTVGDRLGLVGNSGNSSYPHLHLHVQRGDGVGGQGVVPTFRGSHATIDGIELRDAVLPLTRGMFVGKP